MPPSGFDEAVAALLDSLDRGERAAFGGDELAVILRGLGRFLRSRFPGLPREDVVDIVNEALLGLMTAATEGSLDRSRSPAAYLTTIAYREAIDVLGRRERAAEPEEIAKAAGESDPIPALLELLSDRETILDLMRHARDSGQDELNDLIRCWIDLDSAGEAPTLRKLAARLSISHTEVGRRLDRLARLR
jgi:DNA-directed RNA polymerase specialized sigma24 family protein